MCHTRQLSNIVPAQSSILDKYQPISSRAHQQRTRSCWHDVAWRPCVTHGLRQNTTNKGDGLAVAGTGAGHAAAAAAAAASLAAASDGRTGRSC
jgi:hypothetical protein